MKEVTVKENEAGQRLDKLLSKYLNKAPKSFIYKMLRKKNITLNGKKASGSEMTNKGDRICFFLSDDTYSKFSETSSCSSLPSLDPQCILYEDKHIVILNKPAGLLSQKADSQDISVNELLIGYLLKKGEVTDEELRSFRPSVCNRLDRNTSGIVLAGKTLKGLQFLSEILRDRSLHKYYQCIVWGQLFEKKRAEGFLIKDRGQNKSAVGGHKTEGAKPISTEYRPILTGANMTLLEVWLITGRSHQIRAHLAQIGHPIVGDGKYGNTKKDRKMREIYGVSHQLLHAYRLVMPKLEGEFSYLSGREFIAPLPNVFEKISAEMYLARERGK